MIGLIAAGLACADPDPIEIAPLGDLAGEQLAELPGDQDGKPSPAGGADEMPLGGEITTGPVEIEPDRRGRIVMLIDPTDIGLGAATLIAMLGGLGAARRRVPMPSHDRRLGDVLDQLDDLGVELAALKTATATTSAALIELQRQEESSALTIAGATDATAITIEQVRLLIEILSRQTR